MASRIGEHRGETSLHVFVAHPEKPGVRACRCGQEIRLPSEQVRGVDELRDEVDPESTSLRTIERRQQ